MPQRELYRRSVHHAAQVRELFQRGAEQAQTDPLVSRALDALALLLEALETTEEELASAHERQLDGYALLQAEHQTYQELFLHAPFAYLTTRLDGTIKRANEAAQRLLASSTKLIGQPLATLLPEMYRREWSQLLQRLGSTGGTERLALSEWTLEGTAITNSAGRPYELRWVALPESAAQQHSAPAIPPNTQATHTYAHCFAEALHIVQQTAAWEAAGLQLAHLLAANWADLVILERSTSTQRERIIGVRSANERSEICVVRQRVDATATEDLPAAGGLAVADDTFFRTLGLFTEVSEWSRARLPLHGYHAVAHVSDCRWHVLCFRGVDHGDYTLEQRAMIDVLVERMRRP